MRILALGGTGAMGVHLVQVLAELGHEVHVTSRSRSGKTGNINYITDNAHDEAFLNHLLSERWDGIVDFMVYSTAAFKKRYQQLLKATAHYMYLSSSRVYANRSAKVMEATVHNGIERCLINCSQTEQIVEEMVQRYIAGTGPKRKLGAWHRFKICNNRPAQQSIAYLFKITQCLEVFSTLLPAVALEQYSSKKAQQALKGIGEKFLGDNSAGDKTQ